MQVAAGAADLFASELQHIRSLSQQGAKQLAADLEYFCNVLAALGVSLPPILGTWQVALAWPTEEFAVMSNNCLQDESIDRAAIEQLARVRNLGLSLPRNT